MFYLIFLFPCSTEKNGYLIVLYILHTPGVRKTKKKDRKGDKKEEVRRGKKKRKRKGEEGKHRSSDERKKDS